MSMAPTPQRARPRRGWVRLSFAQLLPVCLLLLLTASGAVYFRAPLLCNNLHAVVPGRVYRSAQPSAETLDGFITRLELRTVVSLRGGEDDWAWFAEERDVCERRSVELKAVHFDPNRLPPKGELERLVEILDASPHPVLLHCSRGIDRAGLGSAVAQLLAGETPEQAAGQFALKYGYLAAAGHSDLPRVLSDYEAWLRRSGREHAPDVFRAWVRDVYVPYFYRADIRLCPGCPDDTALTAGRALEPGTWEVAPDATQRLHFELTNTSPAPWQFRSTMDHGVHLGLIVERLAGASVAAEPATDRRELRAGYEDLHVAPGQSIGMHAEIPPLRAPGRYRVTVDLVDESVTWFGDMGSPTLQFELRVHNTAVAGL